MTPYDKQINNFVKELIDGNTVFIADKQQRTDVQNRLRFIKKNCTQVLKQMKDNNW